MSTELKILKLKVRIPLLESRPKDNGRVVQKLKRQFKQLTGEEYVAPASEEI